MEPSIEKISQPSPATAKPRSLADLARFDIQEFLKTTEYQVVLDPVVWPRDEFLEATQKGLAEMRCSEGHGTANPCPNKAFGVEKTLMKAWCKSHYNIALKRNPEE
mmetsp:Transcript_43077/g.50522  ORF Transcript_43077/g.50522 Transcript_43077/m.50522 type:complete len:106 (+) Transcript_43077:1-318(+)